jgi:uncharacterized protein
MTPEGWLGAGVSYRRRHHRELWDAPERPRVLEVIPEHFLAAPEAIERLADAFDLVFHAVGLSVATAPTGPARGVLDARLARMRDLVRRARPAWFSDHLAITVSPDGLDLGHLAPVCHDRGTLAIVVDRVRAWQDVLLVPIALENIAAPFVVPGATMSEPEFLHRLVDASGCRLLLDVTNLLLNGRNLGFDPLERLREYPLHAVVQIHLAGGVLAHGWWVDSHSQPVEPASHALLAALAGRAPARAIIIERDERLPPLSELLSEAAQAQATWEQARSTTQQSMRNEP